jgi:hypothetical protein
MINHNITAAKNDVLQIGHTPEITGQLAHYRLVRILKFNVFRVISMHEVDT